MKETLVLVRWKRWRPRDHSWQVESKLYRKLKVAQRFADSLRDHWGYDVEILTGAVEWAPLDEVTSP